MACIVGFAFFPIAATRPYCRVYGLRRFVELHMREEQILRVELQALQGARVAEPVKRGVYTRLTLLLRGVAAILRVGAQTSRRH